jgi:hypothetical protein
MSSPSNVYAEKIFSEHPLVLWALDDAADFVSLISEQDRDISDWDISGGSAILKSLVVDEPFGTSYTTEITGSLTSQDFGQIVCISPDTIGGLDGINFLSLNSDLSTFAIGAYVYSEGAYLDSIEIGYEHYDSVSGSNVQKTKRFDISVSQKWMFVAETFDIPNDNSTMRVVFKINYIGGASSTEDYKFLINGLSVGQWSEEFNSVSLGVVQQNLPSSIALPASKVVEAKAYGIQESTGYYFINDYALLAKNTGIPMVYGASNVTVLSPSTGPSLIVPGYGFLNSSGEYRDYTFEAWLRIGSDSTTEKRILGPISSEDGIYVHGPLIILKVGDLFGSYFVGEWQRPMLININYSRSSVSLLINGEEVVSLNIANSALNFPDKTNSFGKTQDWIGLYSYEDVSPIEVDCIAIYPYKTSQVMLKRRWIYGQGVEFPENINTAYSGTSVFIDYPFANYANSYSYPDIGKWDQAIVENLSVDNGMLSSPTLPEPKIIFNNKTREAWNTDIALAQSEMSNSFVSLYPNSQWNQTQGYILVDRLSVLSEDVKGFYGVFREVDSANREQILFQIDDVSSSNYFQIKLASDSIDYVLYFNSQEEIIYRAQKHYLGEDFSVGINIQSFVSYFGGNLASFFGKKSLLSMSIGGNKEFDKTFLGHIYNVGFCTKRNLKKISHLFSNRGIVVDQQDLQYLLDGLELDGGEASTTFWTILYDGGTPATIATANLQPHIASYTISPKSYFGNFVLDISADSYWEDYVPLSYFAKYVTDANNQSRYELDFIQFNINYPAPSIFSENETSGSWTYDELQSQYAVPVQREYSSLDNQLFTGYQDYLDLKNKAVKSYNYDTSSSLVKTYITFQYLKNGANESSEYFTNIVSAPKNGVIIPGSSLEDWSKTKYEVVDNMIIYPPSGINFSELALVTHIEFIVDGLSYNPIKIKKLQYASQALNDTTPVGVGTRFGTKIYPYKKSGVYYDYKSRNPFSIYKGSSPYLYLTRTSGIQIRGDYDPLVDRGLSIPLNEGRSSDYKIIASQMAMRYDEDFFPFAPTEIFQIESRGSLLKFYIVANHPSGKRAKIYAVNAKTGLLENGIAFYWNGKIVKEPNITVKQWGMLGISFSNTLNLNNYIGFLRISGPILINMLSHYQSTNLQEVQQITARPWIKVKTSGSLDFDWEYWDTSYIWNGVLVLSSRSYYGVDPSDIYKTYMGTNKIIIDDSRPLTLNSYEYNILKDISWQTQTISAV